MPFAVLEARISVPYHHLRAHHAEGPKLAIALLEELMRGEVSAGLVVRRLFLRRPRLTQLKTKLVDPGVRS